MTKNNMYFWKTYRLVLYCSKALIYFSGVYRPYCEFVDCAKCLPCYDNIRNLKVAIVLYCGATLTNERFAILLRKYTINKTLLSMQK